MAATATFEFVNTSRPNQNLEPATRRLVRRNATLHRSRHRKIPPKPKEDVDQHENKCRPRIGARLQLFPVGMQQYMYNLIEYSDKVMFPSTFPLRNIYQHHPSHRMNMCLVLQDLRVRDAQLALASLRYSREPCNDDSGSSILTGLKHQQRAIEGLKTWLAASGGANADIGALMCISHLASIEIILKNETGWQSHINALKKLSEDSNTIHSISLAQYTMIDSELCGCYFFDKQPSLVQEVDLDCVRGAIPDDYENRRAFLVALSGSQEEFSVDNRALECVLQLQDLTKMINPEGTVAYPELYIRLYVSTRIAVEYKLFRILGEEHITPFSHIMCHAAQIYVNKVPRTFPRGSLYLHQIAERLKKAMESALNTLMTVNTLPASMLWVAAMGAVGAQDGPLRAWFLNWIALACHSLGVTTLLDAQLILNSWLWSSQLLDGDAVALWEELDCESLSSTVAWSPSSEASS